MRPPTQLAQKHREKHKTDMARRLRSEATNAERKLWAHLRRKQLGGMKFRRQHPVGPYIVDFCCPAAKLVLELDGGQHHEAASIEYDMRRTEWLNAAGYRVMRFGNPDIFKNLQDSLDTIWRALVESGVPLPPQATPGP